MIAPTRVVIIGAGWAGLVAAKTYLQIAQSLNRPLELVILDEGQSPGGTWSPERIYSGLVAETPNGLFEYTDYSMVDVSMLSPQQVSGQLPEGLTLFLQSDKHPG
jgi:dimethylaniline monooxygenase (N-oxide forming)